MEQVLEGSVYRQLLKEDGWVEAAEPWLTEDDLEPFHGSGLGIDAAGRCQRLYEAWETRQRPA